MEQIEYVGSISSNKIMIKLEDKFINLLPNWKSIVVQMFDEHDNLINNDDGFVSVYINGTEVLHREHDNLYGSIVMKPLNSATETNTYLIYKFDYSECTRSMRIWTERNGDQYKFYLSESNGCPYIQIVTIAFYFAEIGKVKKIILLLKE